MLPGCSWSRGRFRRLCPYLFATTSVLAHCGGFAIDCRQQIIDVIPLQHAVAQRLERLAILVRIPARAQLLELALVRFTFPFDRPPRAGKPVTQPLRVAASFARLANLVELLVEREYLLEQRRRHLWRSFAGLADGHS